MKITMNSKPRDVAHAAAAIHKNRQVNLTSWLGAWWWCKIGKQDSRNYGEGFCLTSGIHVKRQKGNSCDFKRAWTHLHLDRDLAHNPGMTLCQFHIIYPRPPRGPKAVPSSASPMSSAGHALLQPTSHHLGCSSTTPGPFLARAEPRDRALLAFGPCRGTPGPGALRGPTPVLGLLRGQKGARWRDAKVKAFSCQY